MEDDAEGVLVIAGFDRNGIVPADVRFMSGSKGSRLASRANNFFYSNGLPSHIVSRHRVTNVRVMSRGGVMVSGWSARSASLNRPLAGDGANFQQGFQIAPGVPLGNVSIESPVVLTQGDAVACGKRFE